MNETSLIMSEPELLHITGYKRAVDQLPELHRQGFHRARRSPRTGHVILERAHYDAICAGARLATEPKVRAPVLRHLKAA